ncbi:MAG: response regulator [Proteobacteria bacterium]|nr:response regulator [Pseudomonadota bacterium]
MENYNLENLKVLVLDDHAPMRRILMSLLRELGINRLTQSDNAVQALRSLQDTDPDLIITDALMEPMDGLEFTRKIREGEAGVDPFVPIIMVSGQAEMRFIIKARDAGITEFLAKPISARAVYMRICNVITSPRPFVRVADFFGPDRRRQGVVFGDDERRDTPHDYGREEKEA